MSRVLSGLILITILSMNLPCVALGDNASLCVAREAKDCSCDSPHRSVITIDFKEAYARVVLDEPENAKVELTWYAPDGTVAAHNIRTTTYSSHLGGYVAWDGVKLKGALGWWRVEVYYEGGYLSKEFLLTENRQVITVVNGTKTAKLRTLREVDPAGEFGRDVLSASMEDEDPDIRAAALARMGGLTDEWAVVDVREGLWDQDGSVRLSALRSAGALPDWEREMVYISALGSEDREFRLTAVNGLLGYSDEGAAGALMRALDDRYAAVRLAALNGLVRAGAAGLSTRLVKLVSDGDYELAATALKAVIALPASDSHRTEALREAALSVHEDLARAAVDALLPDGGRDDIPAYMKHFKGGYNRRGILQAIAKIPGREATQALADAYHISGEDETLRLIAVRGLAGRDDAGTATLGEAVQDNSVAVRLEALKSARSIPGAKTRFDVASLALMDKDPSVKRAAVIFLAEMKTVDAYSRVMDAIPDPAVREDAFAVIQKALDPSLATLLSEKGLALEDAVLRQRIVEALASGPVDADPVIPYLNDTDARVRIAAVAALGGMQGAKAAYGLYMAGRDQDAAVRRAAGAALGEIGSDDLRGGLGIIIDKGFLDERQAAFVALSVTDPGTLEMLVDRIPAGNRELLAAALEPILIRGGDGSVPALVKGMKAGDARLAAEVASRLAGSELPQAGDALEGAFIARPALRGKMMEAVTGTVHETQIIGLALSDDDLAIRLKAASMIKDLQKDDARGPVRDALNDPDPVVRLEAARAAGVFRFMDELIKAADDDAAQVREAAAEGLSVQHNPDSARVLASLCLDGEERVSRTAVSGLVLMKEVVPDKLLTGLVRKRGAPASVKTAAVEILTGRPGRENAEAVSSLLADEDQSLADLSRDALISMGRDALPAVYPMLKSDKACYRALEVIGALPDSVSEKKVLGVIGGLKGPELVKAVDTLAVVGGPGSLRVLAGLYGDGDLLLRESLLKAVTGLNLGGDEPELAGMLVEALDSADEEIRFYAVRAVGEVHVVSLKSRLEGMRISEPSALVRREVDLSLGKL